MAVRDKMTKAEKAAAETLVTCPGCKGAGMISPKARAVMVRAMPDLEAIDLTAEFLDEDPGPEVA